MASLLSVSELDDLNDLYFDSHDEAAIRVYTCGRALDNVGQLAGVPMAAWVERPNVTGALVRRFGRRAPETFDDPERLDALFRARYTEVGKVRAGDVLREADGALWLVFEPKEEPNGYPRVSAGLERVPNKFAPAYLRTTGLRPAGTEGGVSFCAYATLDGLTATLDTSAFPVPLGRKVLGFSSRGNLDPLRISVSDDGGAVSFDFPADLPPLDPSLDWVVFAY